MYGACSKMDCEVFASRASRSSKSGSLERKEGRKAAILKWLGVFAILVAFYVIAILSQTGLVIWHCMFGVTFDDNVSTRVGPICFDWKNKNQTPVISAFRESASSAKANYAGRFSGMTEQDTDTNQQVFYIGTDSIKRVLLSPRPDSLKQQQQGGAEGGAPPAQAQDRAQDFLRLAATPQDVKIDAGGKYLYWSEGSPTGARISRCPLDLGGLEGCEVLAESKGVPGKLALDYENQAVFWSGYNFPGCAGEHGIFRTTMEQVFRPGWKGLRPGYKPKRFDRVVQKVACLGETDITGLAVKGGHLFLSSAGDGSIRVLDFWNRAPRVVVGGLRSPRILESGGEDLVWLDEDDTTLRFRPLPARPSSSQSLSSWSSPVASVVLNRGARVGSAAMAGDTVYFSTPGGAILKLDLGGGGGDPEEAAAGRGGGVASTPGLARTLVVDTGDQAQALSVFTSPASH